MCGSILLTKNFLQKQQKTSTIITIPYTISICRLLCDMGRILSKSWQFDLQVDTVVRPHELQQHSVHPQNSKTKASRFPSDPSRVCLGMAWGSQSMVVSLWKIIRSSRFPHHLQELPRVNFKEKSPFPHGRTRLSDLTNRIFIGKKTRFQNTQLPLPSDSSRDIVPLLSSDRWRSPTTFEMVTFALSQKGN